MINLIVNRLYNLNLNSFYNSSFFFFTLSLQNNYYNIFKKENLKISYYNMYAYTDLIELSLLNNKNQVYIIYNSVKYESFSLSKILSKLYSIKVNNDVNFNTCLAYQSILYSYFYYNYNIKYCYFTSHLFFKQNYNLLIHYLKIKYLLINNYSKHIKIINYLIKKFYLIKIFNIRFFYI